MKTKLILFFILFLASFLRFYNIDKIPPSMSWDEVSIGYNAYSILKTGKDEWGQVMPLAFKSFGEYKYPFPVYASVISVYFFGLNEFALRFPAALFGVINIFLIYLLVLKLFKNKFIALTAAFLLTISPWHIQFSRVIWDTNFALFFFLLGLYCFLKSIQDESTRDPFGRVSYLDRTSSGFGKPSTSQSGFYRDKKNYLLIVSFILFGITAFTYNGAKVFMVLFLPVLLFSQKSHLLKQKRYLFYSLVIFSCFMIINLLDPNLSGINRFKQLDFIQADVVKTTSYQMTKVYSLGKVELTARQYLMYFSPRFLFISGDANLRHSTQAVGEVYWVELLFIPMGVYFLMKKEPKYAVMIIGWLLLAPIPGSFTREAPHAIRGMFMLGVWQILAAIGIYFLYSHLKDRKRYLIVLLFVFSFASFVNYFGYYLYDYPKVSSQYWQYGYKQAAEYIDKNYNNYDFIVITRADGEPQIFTLLYLKFDPLKYQTDKNLIREKVGNWIQVLRFDKFFFPDLGNPGTRYEDIVKQNIGKKILFIGKPGDFSVDRPILYTIYYLNGKTAFEVVDNK